MAKIEIIIRDDNGTIINEGKTLEYNLGLGKEKFTDIEDAVEQFRIQCGKEITEFLLYQAQQKFIKEKKTIISN